MMVSLFSVFDPVAGFGISLNWLSVGLVVMAFPVSFYWLGGKVEEVWRFMMTVLSGLFKEVSFPNFMGLIVVSMGLILLISANDAFGLFPYVFTGTSHIVVTVSLGLVMWMMSFMMGWLNSFSMSSAHLVPEGAPLGLAPFMVIIESVSQVIRPLTLSVRLAANMMAGHLIIGLIGSISMFTCYSFFVSVVLQSVMLVLEWAVAFIQAFVFSILVMLYSLEYY